MSKSLVDYLQEIPDPRKSQGSTQDFWKLLLVMIMGIMSGYHSYQGLGRFVERHRGSLIQKLKLKHGQAPSYSTLRRVMMNVDYEKLNNAFNGWVREQGIPTGAAIAGDGKSLRNTVKDYDNHQQRFISMVSLFSQEQGVVVGTAIMDNKKESEIGVIQQLISQLNLEEHLLTLYTVKKNSRRDCREQQRLHHQGETQSAQTARCDNRSE